MSRRQTVCQTLEEPLQIHRFGSSVERHRRIAELLDLVALPETVLDRLPRSLSGGQRQRVSIARALALKPSILVCDEPLSALDVSIRAHIVNLFTSLQKQLGLTIVIVAHDLAIVREICTSVTVMSPSEFTTAALDSATVNVGARFGRIFLTRFKNPPGFGKSLSRFSDPRRRMTANRLGVFYLGSSLKVCFVEAVLRDDGPLRMGIPSDVARGSKQSLAPRWSLAILEYPAP